MLYWSGYPEDGFRGQTPLIICYHLNMSEKLEKILVWIVKIGVALILFLPLLVYKGTFYPFIFPKAIVFQVLTEIIFIIWLFLFLYAKDRKINFRHPLIISLTVFVIVLFLTSLCGLDFRRSFWSTEERMNGLVTILHLYMFFLILSGTFKRKEDWRFLVWSSLSCSLLVGLYGLGQKMGLDFLIKTNDYQMTATLGNPIFLAVYAMLNVFLALWLVFWSGRKTGKILGLIMMVFNIWVMLSAASRGVMLAFGISLFCFLFFVIFNSKSRLLKASIIVLLFVILSGLVFIQLPQFSSQISEMPIFVRRLAHFTTSAESRLDAWIIGLKGFIDRPLSGWGWENYNLIFNKYYNPVYLARGMESTWFDRSHNQVIDIMSLSGAVGLVSYLAVFGAIFWLAYKKVKQRDILRKKIPLLILGLLFLAYFIQNLFVFDTPAPLILFYFSLALFCFVITESEEEVKPFLEKISGQEMSSTKRTFPLPVLILLIVIIFSVTAWRFNLEPFHQSRLGALAWNTAKVDFNSALYRYQQALTKSCFVNADTRVYLAQMIAEGHGNIGETTTPDDLQMLGLGTELAIGEYKKNLQEHPFDARSWLYLGQLYGLGVKYDRSYIKEAKKALNRALELSPDRQQVYFELARIFYYEKNYAEAFSLLEQAVILSPEVEESRNKLKKMVEVVQKEKPDLAELAKAEKFLEYLGK